jgi:membrane-associated protein
VEFIIDNLSAALHWMLQFHNSAFLADMIARGGIAVVVLIIFAESGLLAGFFLPGDSLLITAGVLTTSSAIGGRPLLSLAPLMVASIIAAIVGDQVGFYLGGKSNSLAALQNRPKLKKFLDEARVFFAEYGARAVIYARFVPIMRTFVPFAAGLSRMPYSKFVRLNVGSGLFWVVSMLLIGHFLGKSPLADQLHKIIIMVLIVSVLPVVITALKRYRQVLRKRENK